MTHDVPLKTLGPLIALCKIQATETFEFCAREASHVRALRLGVWCCCVLTC